MSYTSITTTIFSELTADFDANVLTTITSGSTRIIGLISPLMAVCFSIYVLLICWTYWQGRNDEPINDFLMRMATWAFILTCGMNIQFYTTYIVPFANGLGEELAGAITGQSNPISGLDSLLSAYINACAQIYDNAHNFQIIGAVWVITVMVIFATPFMALAVAYIILAKFALELLLALGPLFISAALFPPVRQFFWNWAGQCLNYALLESLFAGAGAIEVAFAQKIAPAGSSFPTMKQVVEIDAMGLVFFIVALNLPGLASALASGIGISTMTGKLGTVGRALMAGARRGGSGSSKTGGSIAEA
ncbi:type IV secretion system protein [Paraburkholderia hospita]|uniref:Conjugal transfer protein TrbL n=1 Tax=Paraburkholderia hospita TaxID=169430 RepID=A0AAN1MRD2_9BURK|nr:type IV secretion system protein [Paraburkholderia hospita]AUT76705.1 conjugal transfer protein TrbL [Paraburkholderia hospita]OUL95584.1 conjugal transfer protein TrbL [Paraburkholderia hospita]SEI18906.1 type IV secretion system protein VirB6 [Paraburkholderia hospita]